MRLCIILASLLSLVLYSNTNGNNSFCFNIPPFKYVCPDPTKTYLQCFGRKIPIGKGASSTDVWTTATLIVLPGDKLRCTVFCRNKNNAKISDENCHSRLFSFKASRGIVKDFDKAETSSFHFFYEADRDIKDLADKETSVNLQVKYKELGTDPLVHSGDVQVIYPPLIGVQSTLVCPFNYVRFRAKMDCSIEPKAQEGRVVPASPFEFDVKLTEESNLEYGDFAKNSYMSISADSAKKNLIEFQYEAGNKQGCNKIKALISDGIPNYAAVGNQITNSPYTICTVGGNEVNFRGRAVYSVPLVILALAHTVKTFFA